MRNFYKLFFLCFILNLTFIVFADDDHQQISNGYKEFKLGMNRDEVKKKLKYSAEFAPEHIEAVQTRLEPDSHTLTADGVDPINGLVKIAYFYFDDDDKLCQIFVKINEKKVSYQKILKKFNTKYGNPTSFDPQRAIWSDEETILTLEKPCILKYQINSENDSNQNTDISYLLHQQT